ncbi:MAG: hypothetical protein WAP23_03630 [Candidatus Spechtbacterales bacterium]
MKIVLVFDGDDTLWMNEWQYSKARADFFAFLYSEFGDLMPSFILLFPRYFEIDHGLFPVWGIERGRVFIAMQKVYRELLEYFRKKLGEENDRFRAIMEKQPEHEKRIFEIGDQPFEFYDLKWVEGAEKVLSELRNDDRFILCLLTSYDAKVWRDRSKFLGVEECFGDRIKTVSGRKTKQDFMDASRYQDELHHARFLAIGNGESDILPALEISPLWHGIYIPHGSASPVFHNKKGANIYIPPPMDNPRVITLSSIGELRLIDFENFCLKSPREPF